MRETIRRARANGAGEADQILFGRLAAKSGLKLVLTENIPGSEGGRSALATAEQFTEYDKPITIEDVNILRSIGRKSINSFSVSDIEKSQKWAHKFYKELGVKSPFFRAWFGDWRAQDKSQRKIVSVPTIDVSQVELATGDYTVGDTGWTVYAGKTLNDDTRHHTGGKRINVKSLSAIEQILNNAVLLDTVVSEPDTNKKSPNTAFLHKLYTLIEYEGQTYIAKTSVEEFYNQGKNGVSRKAYNLKAIKIESAGGQFRIKNSSSSVPVTDSIYSISDLYDFVKTFDKDFTPAPEVNPKLLNDDGTPKVFYHGTNEEFTVFNASIGGALGKGIYFAESKEYAQGVGKNVKEVYLDIKKPYVAEVPGGIDTDKLKAQGYDGVYAPGPGFWVAFEPTQIKSATDNIGTFSKFNPDIRYALSGKDMRQVAKYDGKNTVYIDAKADRVDTFSALLGHEMFHKMFGSKRVKGLFMQVFNRLDADKKAEVESDYRKFLTAQGKKNIGAELDEEVAAAYAQELFNSPDVWDFILEGEPSLSDRIIAFFGGVPKRYAFADGMDAAAKRWLNHYKKLFNEVAELNRGESARQNAVVVGKLKTTNESYNAENAVSGDLTLTNEQKMQVSEGRSAISHSLSEEFIQNTLDSFSISKVSDSIHVQKNVFSTLVKEGFFTDSVSNKRFDVNEETGMIIETNKSGIDETFTYNNFGRLGKFKKIAKLATIRDLPNIIKNGHVLADNVNNKYNSLDQNKKFAYIEHAMLLDGEEIVVKIAIKKSPQKKQVLGS